MLVRPAQNNENTHTHRQTDTHAHTHIHTHTHTHNIISTFGVDKYENLFTSKNIS